MVRICGRYQPISVSETARPTIQLRVVSWLTRSARTVAGSMKVSPTLNEIPFQTESR